MQIVGSKSLVGRAVSAAVESQAFEKVFISTDNDEIAAEASSYGATLISRPPHLGLDTTSTEEVILYHLESGELGDAQTLCLMQCTSPFIRSAHLVQALERMEETSVSSVFSATPAHFFLWQEASDGFWIPEGHSKSFRPRRQDLPPTVVESGAFYMFDVASFLSEKTRFCGQSIAFAVGRLESLEIDDVEDLEMANALAPLFDC